MACIEAARLAPSAQNRQPWRFFILDDPGLKEKFCDAAFSGIYGATNWARKAPVIVVIAAETHWLTHTLAKAVQRIPFAWIDIGIAGEHVVLQAQALGLGTCWIGWFDVKKAERVLSVPKGISICQLLALGYEYTPYQHGKRIRKSVNDLLFFNTWEKPSSSE